MRSARTGLALAVVMAALQGCQPYTPRPLDLAAHREAWLARTPADEGVGEYARRLAAESGGAEAAFDLSDGVALREGEAIALLFNPDLRMARLRADAALASARHARLWGDPELGVDAERVIRSVPEPWVLGASLGITLPISGRLAVEEARVRAAHRAELRRVLSEEWAVRVALRTAWLEWSAQRRRVELARLLLERLDGIVEIVGRLERAEELSRTEARLFRIERATRASALRALEARALELELDLKALMGLAPDAPVPLVEAMLAAAEPVREGGVRESLEARNPTLAALRAEHEAAEEALRLEVRKQYPDVTIGPGLGVEDGDSRVLLGLSLPVPLWNRNQRGIAEASAQRDLSRGAFETEFERLAARLAAAEVQLSAARTQRAALEAEVVPMVEEQDREARRVAELGEVDTLLLLENLTRLYDTKTALIDARLAEALAAVRLDGLIGPPPGPSTASPEGATP